MTALVTMSRRELDRASTLACVVEGRLTQARAAKLLGLSVRQVRRLYRAYADEGAPALASGLRGRRSNRALDDSIRDAALDIVRARYAYFGPTLAREKLVEVHGFEASLSTVRQWMVEAEIWTPRRLRDRRVHQPRLRRACRGELIQIDGCDHHWFEDRAPRCVLLVFVDDATGELMEVQFARSESTFTYFTSVRRYLAAHGRPVAFYSDKASIFRVNRKQHRGDGLTQFGRAMTDLNIDVICANSAPAKGRGRMHLYESTTGGDTTHARADRGLRWLLFSFTGRARRLDYWKGIGISYGLMIGILLVGDALDLRRFAGMAFVPMVPVFLWMMLAVRVKRWHDRNKSGWWVLIALVPYIGGLWELVECGFLGSGSGLNDFGHNPRGDNWS